MIYLIGAAIVALAGYCIALLLKLTKNHFLHDIALGWFLGGGYYSLAMSILVFAVGFKAEAVLSMLVIVFPVLLVLFKIKTYWPSVVGSIRNIRKPEYFPIDRFLSFKTIIVCYSIFVITLIVVHGASTPTYVDDAVHLRAYSPMLVYMNDLSERARVVIISNGILPSFLTVFFWHLKGGIDHFYINYTILTSFVCFLLLLYLGPAVRGKTGQGLYNLSLVLTLPLFVYHATTTYADVRLIIPFATGFMFFGFYLRDLDIRDLKILVLFFIIAGLVKDKGLILGITGLSISLLFMFNVILKKKEISLIKIMAYTLPVVLVGPYLLYKTVPASKIWFLWGSVAHKLTLGTVLKVFNELFENVLKPAMSGGQINWIATPYMIKFTGFFKSMFSSGNFGIVFYLIIANLLLNLKKILKTPLVWEFAFFSIVFLETYYYAVDWFSPAILHNTTVHRVMMVPAVISCIYLSSLWAEAEGGEREQSRA